MRIFPLAHTSPSGLLPEHADGLVGCPKAVRHVSKVDQCRKISVSFRNLWGSYSITHHGNLETQLKKFPQMRFNAHVGKHACKNDLIDTLFAKLKRQVVDLRAVQLVR